MNKVKNILVALDLTDIDVKLIEYTSVIAEKLGVEKVYFLHNIKKFELAELFKEQLEKINIENIIEDNIEKYEPFKYNYKEGFVRCELYDMEFMMHKFSKIMIDIRNLNEIKNIQDFKNFCKYLESFENNKA